MTDAGPSSWTDSSPGPATVLPPAGRVLWRSAHEAQLEIGTRRLVIDGVGTDAMRHLIGRAVRFEPAPPPVAALQQRLLDAGLLWAARDPDEDLRRRPPHPRLAAELTALSVATGERAAEVLAARHRSTVAVHGGARVGPHVAAVLAAAGVGHVSVLDTTPTRLHHAVPGGLTPSDEGTPLAAAAAAAMQRQAPEVDCVPRPFGESPDLVVLALNEPIGTEGRAALHALGCAHLLVQVASDHGTIGPLVLPGLTSCLRCADLHRLDRDPAWNALAVQLTLPHRAAVASEVAMSTVVAGLAAMQALEFLDGGHPATVEGSLEMHRPDWRVRRRSWPIHPDCDCMPLDRPPDEPQDRPLRTQLDRPLDMPLALRVDLAADQPADASEPELFGRG